MLVLPRHGHILIYIWAIEKDEHSQGVVQITGKLQTQEKISHVMKTSSYRGSFAPRIHEPRYRERSILKMPRPDAIQRYYRIKYSEFRGLVYLAVQERERLGTTKVLQCIELQRRQR